MRIAVVGSGISGLGAAWSLRRRHDVTVYEADRRIGGHSNTIHVPWDGGSIPVDTGFIVYNERNYPNLTKLFAALDVPTQESDMSFGVSIDDGRFEYSGKSARGLFAQQRNLVRPAFQRMLFDIMRFNRDGCRFLEHAGDEPSLGEFLTRGRYGSTFKDLYLLPMAAAIWSTSLERMQDFPARSFLRFFANHGLLTIADQPVWRTVTGGSRVYVEAMTAPMAGRFRIGAAVRAVRRTGQGVEVLDGRGERARYDHVVLACHADQALAVLEQPSSREQGILGAFHYQPNRAVVHRDPALMPRRKTTWSSWNYVSRSDADLGTGISVTYWLNRLQGLQSDCLVLETLNPVREPAPDSVIAEFHYDHPQYTAAALAAQARRSEIQGQGGVWYCGAHWGYGFHEDGLRSGLDVAAALGAPPAWWRPRVQEVRAGAATMPLPAVAKAE